MAHFTWEYVAKNQKLRGDFEIDTKLGLSLDELRDTYTPVKYFFLENYGIVTSLTIDQISSGVYKLSFWEDIRSKSLLKRQAIIDTYQNVLKLVVNSVHVHQQDFKYVLQVGREEIIDRIHDVLSLKYQ